MVAKAIIHQYFVPYCACLLPLQLFFISLHSLPLFILPVAFNSVFNDARRGKCPLLLNIILVHWPILFHTKEKIAYHNYRIALASSYSVVVTITTVWKLPSFLTNLALVIIKVCGGRVNTASDCKTVDRGIETHSVSLFSQIKMQIENANRKC